MNYHGAELNAFLTSRHTITQRSLVWTVPYAASFAFSSTIFIALSVLRPARKLNCLGDSGSSDLPKESFNRDRISRSRVFPTVFNMLIGR